ncbi:uncharacterized protein LOC130512774 [Raphanus sativus]|uniref:Uncharacterized protein LOC130512774 n=1 Tax=Raphanus sativus TaxID=3726 RepID=A0A9W3DU11_RAPSA|nr:uncharacterized protein LOC130512774 [Raphanus sativus]
MTQTTDGALKLIENMAASSANENQESNRSKKGNSVHTQKIDELTAKVDQLLQNNQAQGSGYQNTIPQSNQQAVPAASAPTAGNSPPDDMKNLNIMMQQMLQNQQLQVKALNQVTIDINTRMDSMFTELNSKYDTVSNHIKKIDVQLAQTAETVKKQQEIIRGKSVMNPRVEHCNATEQRREKSEEKQAEQLFAETVLGAEQRTEQSASSRETAPATAPAPDGSTDIPPVRVYVPKVPYPIPPRHLKVLPKVDDPGKFAFPCSIAGEEFEEALCDSGSCVNLVSKAIVDKLGIADVEPSQVTLTFANSSRAVPYGTIRNLPVQVGDCVLHTEFQVVEMNKDHEMPLILGRTFMATVGAIVDMPNERVSFSHINKNVFYQAVPTRFQKLHASCISVFSGEKLKVVPRKELEKNSEIKEVQDGDPHTDTHTLSGNAKVKEKVHKKRVKGDPTMTLTPHWCDEKSIEYEVKCKGTSKPFSKVRVILTDELKEKGEAAVKGLLSRVLKLNMSDCGACFGTSPHAQPD